MEIGVKPVFVAHRCRRHALGTRAGEEAGWLGAEAADSSAARGQPAAQMRHEGVLGGFGRLIGPSGHWSAHSVALYFVILTWAFFRAKSDIVENAN